VPTLRVLVVQRYGEVNRMRFEIFRIANVGFRRQALLPPPA
jgi:hypothetical protein